MCLCVRLQNPHEKPRKNDPKYTDKARKTLLALAMSRQALTLDMLRKLKQEYYRKDYNAWMKRQSRAIKRRARDEQDAAVLAELVFKPFGCTLVHYGISRVVTTIVTTKVGCNALWPL